MHKPARIKVAFPTAFQMITHYLGTKIGNQVRATAFIFAYLILFQTLVFQTPLADGWIIASGIALVIFGLTFFLEGIFLGLMPLGERVGVMLPAKGGLAAVLGFGLVLGIGATLAEPAIAALRSAGAEVTPWDFPLLYSLLEVYPERLVLVIGVGVGLAVSLGMLRFSFGLSLKPFILIIIPIVLALTWYASVNSAYSRILGLAWDSGAVTTGVVTVPLILALGIGVSRTSGSSMNRTGGFGVVMLASALPVSAVLLFSISIEDGLPGTSTEREFITLIQNDASYRQFSKNVNLTRLIFQRGTPQGRRHLYKTPQNHTQALNDLAKNPHRYLGEMKLSQWLKEKAGSWEKEVLSNTTLSTEQPVSTVQSILLNETGAAARAILPLSALLVILLAVILRERTRYLDEVTFGILLSFGGLILVTSGILLGLVPLGDAVGQRIPQELAPSESRTLVIQNFNESQLIRGYTEQGQPVRLLPLVEKGSSELLTYNPQNHDTKKKTYTLNLGSSLPFGIAPFIWGIGLVLLFAFGLGYGSTMAEPALSAMGKTVETMTVGTVRSRSIIRAVSLGVGIGLVSGVVRILLNLPLMYFLIPGYGFAILLTIFSEEDFVGIAWDAGGVTTGPVTVPLVLSLGLGISSALGGGSDGFGILALASLFPILTVLMYGFIIRIRQGRIIIQTEGRGDGT